MRSLRYVPITLAVVCIAAASSTTAQTNPGNITAVESQTPKPGMKQQYEQGRKQKAEWQKQQNDPRALLVFEIVSGQDTGTYLVSRGGLHWADMDHPAVSEAADDEEYNKAVGPYVASLTDSYYELLPKLGNPDMSPLPSKYGDVTIIRVKAGKTADFRTAVGKISEAERKANPSVHVEIYELLNGGYSGTFVVIFPRANWAAFEENPNMKPMTQALTEAYGADETSSTMATLDNSIESEYSEIIQFRQDLSYIPGK
jgi:hypothetical protein